MILRLCLVQCKIFSKNDIFGKGKYFQVFGCIMKIVLENIFMHLVTFWKCNFPPLPTQNLPPHNRKTTKTPPPTPPPQQQKNQKSKRESKKSKSHKNIDRFVGRSKSHKKSKSQRERDRFVGSWREGSGSPAKSKARGVEGSRSKIGSWVRRLMGRRLWVEDRQWDRLRGGDDEAPICVWRWRRASGGDYEPAAVMRFS